MREGRGISLRLPTIGMAEAPATGAAMRTPASPALR
jgi:hypothetical protein